jgi:hypothetical protein
MGAGSLCRPWVGWQKRFFFEKKNQKTFGLLVRASPAAYAKGKSFLLLFFKKEDLRYPIRNKPAPSFASQASARSRSPQSSSQSRQNPAP